MRWTGRISCPLLAIFLLALAAANAAGLAGVLLPFPFAKWELVAGTVIYGTSAFGVSYLAVIAWTKL